MDERYVRKLYDNNKTCLGIFDLIENKFIKDLNSDFLYLVNNELLGQYDIRKRMNLFVYTRQLNYEFFHYEQNLMEYLNESR